MRRIALAMLALLLCMPVLSTPASAQSWREYTYPDNAFAIHFPAEPVVQDTTYAVADGSTVPARTYALTQADAVYNVTVADFSSTALGEREIMEQAVGTLSKGGRVTVDEQARIDRIYGRQLSIVGADGSHASTALFYYRNRLYQIVGTSLPAAAQAGASDAIRFQQSLRFTNDASRNFGFGTQFGLFGQF